MPRWHPDMEKSMRCPDCQGGVLLLKPKPASWSGKSRLVYLCSRACGGLLSAHDDGTPMGKPAPKHIRQRRKTLHDVHVDPVWKSAKNPSDERRRVYMYLSDAIGVEYHTANLTTDEECDQIERLMADYDKWRSR